MSAFRRRLNLLNLGDMEKKLRLIANISVDEECGDITVDKDMQGNAFSLKECYVFAKVVGTASSDGGTYKNSQVKYNGLATPNTVRPKTPEEGKSIYFICHAVCMPGVLYREDAVYNSFMNSSAAPAGVGMYVTDMDADSVNGIEVSPGVGCYFGVGSTIRIYGK